MSWEQVRRDNCYIAKLWWERNVGKKLDEGEVERIVMALSYALNDNRLEFMISALQRQAEHREAARIGITLAPGQSIASQSVNAKEN